MADSGTTAQGMASDSHTENHSVYGPFMEAIEQGNWRAMNEFLNHCPEAVAAKLFRDGSTALHHALRLGNDREEMATSLVGRMTPTELEIRDANGYTPLAIAALHHHPNSLLRLMVEKNSNLPNIGNVPVVEASRKGLPGTTRFLYDLTDKRILNPEHEDGRVGVDLLHHCIIAKLFDVASDLVGEFPKILLHSYNDDGVLMYPIHVLAKTLSAFPGYKEASASFFRLVCAKVSTFNQIPELTDCVYPAIIEATKHGNIEFISEMIKANPDVIYANSADKHMFWHAVENRQEKIFNLVYGATDETKDTLLSGKDGHMNNILHLAAQLPSRDILDRISTSPALQMQREVLWFKEVWSVAKPRYREDLNKDGLTPRQLFCRRHEQLIKDGEKSIKRTATSSTVVGALILTIMFAAAFNVPGGSHQVTGYPKFANKILFKIFIMFDVLSLSSAATSILVFLTILTNDHGDQDFLMDLPRRLMIGVLALFSSIATMMVTFCLALALVLHEEFQFIIPIALVTSIPVILFSWSMLPLLSKISRSIGSSIFDRDTKLPTPDTQVAESTMSYGMV